MNLRPHLPTICLNLGRSSRGCDLHEETTSDEKTCPLPHRDCFGTGAAYRAFALDAVVEPHTEAAVLAADDYWLTAELRGDLSALDARLMPSYRDVTPEGKVHTKQDSLAGVAKHPGKVIVTRVSDPNDRRQNIVEMTETGKARFERLKAGLAEAEDRALAPLAPADRRELLRLLRILHDYHAVPPPSAESRG